MRFWGCVGASAGVKGQVGDTADLTVTSAQAGTPRLNRDGGPMRPAREMPGSKELNDNDHE